MGRGEYWRLIDSQGRPPGLLGMWPSRAVSFIENHDTGACLPTRSAAGVLCSMACSGTARPCPPGSATEASLVGTLGADAFSIETVCLDQHNSADATGTFCDCVFKGDSSLQGPH